MVKLPKWMHAGDRHSPKERAMPHGSQRMTAKENMLHALQDLPADATYEDAMERFLFLAKAERGLQQADAEETISHRELKQKMAAWLK